MKTLYFSKLAWESENKYEHYLDLNLAEHIQIFYVKDYHINVLDKMGELANCEIKITSNDRIRIISDKLFDGKVVFTPKPPISEDKDRLERVRSEIERWSKTIEEMYKNNTINSSAYYAMKGFNVVLNNIIDN